MKNTRFREKLKWVPRLVYFDEDDYLREKARDKKKIQALIDEAEHLFINADDSNERFFLAGTMGNLYRVIGKLNRSIGYLNVSLEIAKEDKDLSKEIIATIRLGESLKYANKHKKALALFEQALHAAYENESAYIDFAFQHKGECLMEMGHYEEAMEAFQDALTIRSSKGNQELVESTEQAIMYLESTKI
uniref:tetratricopeptide repeat protein n=1 Tax=uncultured Allobacillus sp. TaxID=1638025 RepID=UPI002598D3BB|nr:tetratricopeptide repeat protein [uncultured Allobacillus sp.]